MICKPLVRSFQSFDLRVLLRLDISQEEVLHSDEVMRNILTAKPSIPHICQGMVLNARTSYNHATTQDVRSESRHRYIQI